jgi:hypothetical protein
MRGYTIVLPISANAIFPTKIELRISNTVKDFLSYSQNNFFSKGFKKLPKLKNVKIIILLIFTYLEKPPKKMLKISLKSFSSTVFFGIFPY